ncbi:hypothetical protein SCFA_20055 [anaerobic digester metagenome]|uniref:Uncharacterized protein n=1 Tax=anaerobic digester metagenome TaxID=1263854 RepID=A0A485M3S6_9ZZZZ
MSYHIPLELVRSAIHFSGKKKGCDIQRLVMRAANP